MLNLLDFWQTLTNTLPYRMVGSKQPQPVFLSVEEADKHCQAGASVWKFTSTDDGLNPDVVLVGIGFELTFKVVLAAAILLKSAPPCESEW